jgi:hypothetical protein
MWKSHLKKILAGIMTGFLVLIAFAYLRTLNKTELEFRIRINRDLVLLSAYGEPPTFAIWLENSEGRLQNLYVTHRAYENEWEGKPEVPVALPYWFLLNESGVFAGEKGFLDLDAVSGATPQDDVFSIRAEVPANSTFVCWIEMNLSGDFNDYYKESDPEKKISDEYGNGQPALLYRGKIRTELGNAILPELYGMSLRSADPVRPVIGITTADQVFSRIDVEVVRPKPFIIKRISR